MESNRVAPVRGKMDDLEVEKGGVSRERGETEAKSWSELDHLRITHEGLKKNSDTINRY